MIAVSPLALVDMAFIAGRNLRLINRIATLYGIELGYYSRLRLFKLVLLNIAFAGARELVREVGMDWMSQDLAARLSTRAAQGLSLIHIWGAIAVALNGISHMAAVIGLLAKRISKESTCLSFRYNIFKKSTITRCMW